MRLLLRLGEQLSIGTLTAELPDGTVRRFGTAGTRPAAHIVVHRDRLARRFLMGGNLGFCEAYIDGDWSSPDVEALFTLFLVNQRALQRRMQGRFWFRALGRVRHWLNANTRSGSKRNIIAHYDLGNRFFAEWLDPTMTYSSAFFDGTEDLAAAQRRKYARLADGLALAPDRHLLEIGCGWGGFAEYAAAERGAIVTGITISPAQYEFARKRLFEAGLAERADIRLVDYRDVEGEYDHVASIEMFEAVGEAYWPAYFDTLRQRLRPGGTAGLQIITIEDGLFDSYRRKPDYIQRYIFPGGMLPSPAALDREVARAGLVTRAVAEFGEHYARTLRDWNGRFQAAWPRLNAMGYDTRFKRLWEQYLAYCAAGFQVGTINVRQTILGRG
ncbi:MAG: cyclopropane-fatty-acyl-phospholipid synthase family protein [Azospirillaceae bacterium]